jgi:flagellar motor switch protein FliN
MTQEEVDALINSGSNTMDGVADDFLNGESSDGKLQAEKPNFPEMDTSKDNTSDATIDPKLELLYDLQLPVSIELGRTNMLIRDILRLGRGSVVEFDKLVSEPVDILINGKKVAEGEVVVIDKHFGIRITTLVDPADRLRSAKR